MKITPTNLKLEQLFSSSNEQFLVPAYQRRYSWKYEQFANLFDDIDTLKNNESHLFGSIVCLTEGHTAGINTLELVDGQQRITTITILLKALQSKFKELSNQEIVDEIEKLLTCKSLDRTTLNKIMFGDLDNPDYVNLLKGKMDNIINENLLDAYEYFCSWLEDFNEEKTIIFYSKLMNNTSLIRLDVINATDAYKLFETINNRGLKLSHTDIIKNFLLGHASTIGKDTLDEVRENWKNLIINMDSMHNMDSFFRQLMVYKLKVKVCPS